MNENLNNGMLYNLLFNTRIDLLNENHNENIIIRRLKCILIDNNIYNNINEILFNFYNYYDIIINREDIENININIINQPEYKNNENDDNDDDDDDVDDDEKSNIVNNVINNIVVSNYNIARVNFEIDQPIGSYIQMIQSRLRAHNLHVQNDNQENNLLVNYIINNEIPSNLESVSVTLNNDDLNNLPIIKLEENMDYDCSICLDHLEKENIILKLNCTHCFHKDCIENYLKNYNYKCPVCRKEAGQGYYNL